MRIFLAMLAVGFSACGDGSAAGAGVDAGGPDGGRRTPPRYRTDVSPYLLIEDAAIRHLRAVFDPERTRPCEIQVVGDSICESFLFLNPLTFDPDRPDMAYADPTHCRIFGQPSIFLDVPQTAATGQTAEWGLEGTDGWGGVRNLHYPMTYIDRDASRRPIGPREAWPELATILFGTNDLRDAVRAAGPGGLSPTAEAAARSAYRRSLAAIARWFLERGTVPVLLTLPPGEYAAFDLRIGDGPPLGERWAAEVRDLGVELRVPVFDVQRLLLDQPDWPSLLSDGVHPNEEGYAVINDAFHATYRDLRRLVLVR